MSPKTPSDPAKSKAADAEKAEAQATEAKAAKATEEKAHKADKAPAAKKAPAKKAQAADSDKPAAEKKPASKKPAAARDHSAAAEKATAAKATAEKTPPRQPAEEPKAQEGDQTRASGQPAKRAAAPRPVVVRAQARYVRTSARKARMVCGHIRGKSIAEARAILAFTPRGVARDWSKLLESAIANAENNHELLQDDLFVREAYADEGHTIKRFRPRAKGSASPILKRTSHLTITLTPKR